MKKFWELFRRCDHYWEHYHSIDLKQNGKYFGFVYVLRCKHCGDLKEKRVVA